MVRPTTCNFIKDSDFTGNIEKERPAFRLSSKFCFQIAWRVGCKGFKYRIEVAPVTAHAVNYCIISSSGDI